MLINLGFGALVLICFYRGFIFKYIMVDHGISEIYQIYVGILGLRSPNSSLSELVMILMIAIITIPSPQIFSTRNIYLWFQMCKSPTKQWFLVFHVRGTPHMIFLCAKWDIVVATIQPPWKLISPTILPVKIHKKPSFSLLETHFSNFFPARFLLKSIENHRFVPPDPGPRSASPGLWNNQWFCFPWQTYDVRQVNSGSKFETWGATDSSFSIILWLGYPILIHTHLPEL